MLRLSHSLLPQRMRPSHTSIPRAARTQRQPTPLIGRPFVSMNIISTFDETTYIATLDRDASEETLRKREKDIHSLLTKPLPHAPNAKPSPSYYMAGVGTGKIASISNSSKHKCILIKGFLDVKRLEAIRKLDWIESCEMQNGMVEKRSGKMSDDSHVLAK